MAIHTPRDKSAKHPHNSQLVSTKISALSFPKTTNFNLFTCGNFHVNNFHSTTYIVNIPCVYYHGIRKANHATTENCEVKDTRNRKNRDKKKKDAVTQRTSWNSLRATSTSFSFSLFSFPLFLRSCFASAPPPVSFTFPLSDLFRSKRTGDSSQCVLQTTFLLWAKFNLPSQPRKWRTIARNTWFHWQCEIKMLLHRFPMIHYLVSAVHLYSTLFQPDENGGHFAFLFKSFRARSLFCSLKTSSIAEEETFSLLFTAWQSSSDF